MNHGIMGTQCKNCWCPETEDRSDIGNVSDIAACGAAGEGARVVLHLGELPPAPDRRLEQL